MTWLPGLPKEWGGGGGLMAGCCYSSPNAIDSVSLLPCVGCWDSGVWDNSERSDQAK